MYPCREGLTPRVQQVFGLSGPRSPLKRTVGEFSIEFPWDLNDHFKGHHENGMYDCCMCYKCILKYLCGYSRCKLNPFMGDAFVQYPYATF